MDAYYASGHDMLAIVCDTPTFENSICPCIVVP